MTDETATEIMRINDTQAQMFGESSGNNTTIEMSGSDSAAGDDRKNVVIVEI